MSHLPSQSDKARQRFPPVRGAQYQTTYLCSNKWFSAYK